MTSESDSLSVDLSGPKAMATFFANRAVFFRTVHARVPYAQVSHALAIVPLESQLGQLVSQAAEDLASSPVESDAFRGYLLQDPFKKHDYGANLGLLVVSLRELFESAIRFEVLGINFVTSAQDGMRCKSSAEGILKILRSSLNHLVLLEDGYRYHRTRLV